MQKPYVIEQVVLRESIAGTGSANLGSLEKVLNKYHKKGYHLHTITPTESDSKGIQDGDLIQATVIFELSEKW